MLKKLLSILENSVREEVISGTLFCHDYNISDTEYLISLNTENCFEQTIYPEDLKIGDNITLELSLYKLKSVGFYYNFDSFITDNKYQNLTSDYYIYELKCYASNPNDSLLKYKTIISLIEAISNNAKHIFQEVDISKSIIYREDKSLILPLDYNADDVILIKIEDVEKINLFISTLKEIDSEKKFLFVNELIDFLSIKKEDNRFQHLILHFSEFYEKCNNSYKFYLSGFSHNKLKFELDSKALEYTQKIQSVINDSQTKLIAIPTAFILVFVTFDFIDLFALKNIASMISLFIFAIIIQLFLNNQKSTLKFIWRNIESYKEILGNNNIEEISTNFSLAKNELRIQRNRLFIVEVILWLIPVSLYSVWLFLIYYHSMSYVIGLLFFLFVLFKLYTDD